MREKKDKALPSFRVGVAFLVAMRYTFGSYAENG
jgi:hypothetical protein